MIKVVTHIDCPKEWESTNDWDSHRELLYVSMDKTSELIGSVVEFGCGHGSTMLLKDMCRKQIQMQGNIGYPRGFMSFDNNGEWSSKFGCTAYVKDFDIAHRIIFRPRLMFVDCAPAEERIKIIEKYKDICDVIVIHDTEESSNFCYGLKYILPKFRYRLDYRPEGKPHTTAVSNIVNVTAWV